MSLGWPRIGLLVISIGFSCSAFASKQSGRERPASADCGIKLTPPHYIVPQDYRELRKIAREYKLVIEVMAPNPAALPYSLMDGYRAKTSQLKGCKSAQEGEIAGLVHCPPPSDKNSKEYYVWLENKKYLESLGYKILSKEYHYLVEKDGKRYYSDYDLLGIYNAETGESAYSDEIRDIINARLGRNLIRHGPLAEFDQRHKIKVKFPVLVFTPYAPGVTTIARLDDLKTIESEYRIPWIWSEDMVR